MKQMGMDVRKVRAGHANMFLSDVFADAFANTTGATVELYDTDGAAGAARAAGVGAGIYSFSECFAGMKKIRSIEPSTNKIQQYADVYERWKDGLSKL
ncbi:MAG: hypothetical protein H0X41_11305 [Chitinophagaceae bacterium]|nr:hypothetical protein [Chitinophagaceae bacterium]